MSEFQTNHDSGDENDYFERAVRVDVDAILEQISVSLRVVREADKLPQEIVDYHHGILRAWNIAPNSRLYPIEAEEDSLNSYPDELNASKLSFDDENA